MHAVVLNKKRKTRIDQNKLDLKTKQYIEFKKIPYPPSHNIKEEINMYTSHVQFKI